MLRLVQGVIDFYENRREALLPQFEALAAGQSPDAAMFACADSRVVPNLFASTEPGDLFVDRHAGNFIPPFRDDVEPGAEAIDIEAAVSTLRVKDIIVCGHSGCLVPSALLGEREVLPRLATRLRLAEPALQRFRAGEVYDPELSSADQLSQVLLRWQLENLMTYPEVADAVQQRALRLHAWWFIIGKGAVSVYEPDENRFMTIDGVYGARLLHRLSVG